MSGEPLDHSRDYPVKRLVIGTLEIEQNADGVVTFTDTTSPLPPVAVAKFYKSRKHLAMLIQALSTIEPHPSIKIDVAE